jgi:hypothetical protein
MPKTAGTYPMTPIEDHLARALSLAGRSCREIAELLSRSDKTISLAIERSESAEVHPLVALATKTALMKALSAADRQVLTNVRGFAQWLAAGTDNGYVAALVRLMGCG